MEDKDLAKQIMENPTAIEEIQSIIAEIASFDSNTQGATGAQALNRKIQASNQLAIDYIQTYIENGTEGKWKSPFNWYVRNNVTTQSRNMGYTYPYKYIADELLPTMVLKVTYNAERERRSQQKFNDNAKTLALDMFSFTIFKKHIESFPKKLSGKDVTRYIGKLPSVSRYNMNYSQAEMDTRAKYMRLLWDNANVKSLQLSKKLYSDRSGTPDKSLLPFHIISRDAIEEPTGGWNDTVLFDFDYFTSRASTHGVSLKVRTLNLTESYVHQYITGVPKKNEMTEYDVIFAVDKLLILELDKKFDTTGCPYYQMAIDQLVEELSKPKNVKTLKGIQIINNAEQIAEATKTTNGVLVSILNKGTTNE